MLQRVHINIPFIEAIARMPKYAKYYLKEILSNKGNLEDFAIIGLNEKCSAIVLRKLPPKLSDPGSFLVPCTIGNLQINRALCDLVASIDLMPYFVDKKLGLQEPQPTNISLLVLFILCLLLIMFQNGWKPNPPELTMLRLLWILLDLICFTGLESLEPSLMIKAPIFVTDPCMPCSKSMGSCTKFSHLTTPKLMGRLRFQTRR